MKLSKLINSALVVASIALVPGLANAQTATNNSDKPIAINSNTLQNLSGNIASYLKPFDTAFLAYQGELKTQGIPSGSALVFEYQRGNLSAVDVVKAAINAKKLPVQVLNDKNYLSAVESQLQLFNTNLSY
ncbi:hypothetical protein LC653_34215 [Nostoc sp. CHAB 5784]|uniref:hypothetical protein n=1 Tax=Nostoc mirabile TaxID=2907820 RepID=UPI001E47E8B1|nr:hypothetical protein [Nostoc mirabile]MCC5668774.1 hypothetical protein [Nostoc mirabile CHAB5784]